MATVALLKHYLEYLSSPGVLLVVLMVVGPIYLEVFKNWRLAGASSSLKIPGCFRLGISKQSKLDDQYRYEKNKDPNVDPKAYIKTLFTYPVKSCRGVELAASEVGPTGLKYDRLFTFAQLVSTPDESGAASSLEGEEDVSANWKHQWRFITQREFPRLALVETELWVPKPRTKKKRASSSVIENHGDQSWTMNGGCLIIRFPFEPDFNPFGLRTETVTIALPLFPTEQRTVAKDYILETLSIWKDSPQAVNVTGEIPPDDLGKLKYFLGVSNPLGLFRVDHNNRRAVTRSLPKDRPDESYTVGFADAFPFHLLNLASVQAQDQELPANNTLKGSLDARRFRANVYVSGPNAYDEDSWKKVTIGRCVRSSSTGKVDGSTGNSHSTTGRNNELVETEGEYHVACRTARCKLPNVDQNTGIKDVNEPLTTLNRTRKVDKGAYPHPCLGMQMIPLFQQGILRVGDEVKVLERGEHVYEKMFA